MHWFVCPIIELNHNNMILVFSNLRSFAVKWFHWNHLHSWIANVWILFCENRTKDFSSMANVNLWNKMLHIKSAFKRTICGICQHSSIPASTILRRDDFKKICNRKQEFKGLHFLCENVILIKIHVNPFQLISISMFKKCQRSCSFTLEYTLSKLGFAIDLYFPTGNWYSIPTFIYHWLLKKHQMFLITRFPNCWKYDDFLSKFPYNVHVGRTNFVRRYIGLSFTSSSNRYDMWILS